MGKLIVTSFGYSKNAIISRRYMLEYLGWVAPSYRVLAVTGFRTCVYF